jgi:hypothetical protein
MAEISSASVSVEELGVPVIHALSEWRQRRQALVLNWQSSHAGQRTKLKLRMERDSKAFSCS